MAEPTAYAPQKPAADLPLEKLLELDQIDPLSPFRDHFHLPQGPYGRPATYLCGHSLGLQPKHARRHVEQILDDWAQLGVLGHLEGQNPWLPYHEFLTSGWAHLVGAQENEVVGMNSLTVNLHLLMASFFQPEGKRRKILMEYKPFPSDVYAFQSQLAWHGLDPEQDLIELPGEPETNYVSREAIMQVLEEQGEEIALVMLGGVNYYSGQFFPLEEITQKAHEKGCTVGLDLAHAVGNIPLRLHDWGVDFAAWCSYKYVNGGPGGLAGAFVHEKHAKDWRGPRLAGWWGQDKASRFQMEPTFQAIPTAEGWQLSNPPVLAAAPVRASLQLFMQADIQRLRARSLALTGYLADRLEQIPGVRILTPAQPKERGCMLCISLTDHPAPKQVFDQLQPRGIIADWREPSVMRITPAPLYNTFAELWHFAETLAELLEKTR